MNAAQLLARKSPNTTGQVVYSREELQVIREAYLDRIDRHTYEELERSYCEASVEVLRLLEQITELRAELAAVEVVLEKLQSERDLAVGQARSVLFHPNNRSKLAGIHGPGVDEIPGQEG